MDHLKSSNTARAGTIPVFVINLLRDTERREQMQRQLSALGLPFQFVDAVDGRTVPPEEAEAHMQRVKARYGRTFTLGELGCALSHMRLLEVIANGPDPFACVMEDDIAVNPDTVKILAKSAIAELPPFDVLRLHSNPHRQHKSAWDLCSIHGRSIVVPFRIGWGAQAQVFTRTAARRLHSLPISAPIDHMLYYRGIAGLRVIEVRPSLTYHLFDDGRDSNTAGWQAWPKSLKLTAATRLEPFLARLNFVRTWGAAGVVGLIRSRYQPPASTHTPKVPERRP